MAIPRITKEELKARLDGDTADIPVILDARLKYPYEHSTVMLPGARRVNPDDLDTSELSTDRDVVAYDSDPEEIVSARFEDGRWRIVTAKGETDIADATGLTAVHVNRTLQSMRSKGADGATSLAAGVSASAASGDSSTGCGDWFL